MHLSSVGFHPPSPSPLRFGFSLDKPTGFSDVRIITDFNDHTSNARIEAEIKDIARYITAHKSRLQSQLGWMQFKEPESRQAFSSTDFPQIADIPYGNVTYQSRTLAELGARRNRELFVHVTDPGVGNGEDRSILVTQNHGVYIGPNNGSLSLLTQQLKAKNEPMELFPINFQHIEALKRIQLNNPDYRIPPTFHGRDVFAVITGALLAGVKPQSFKNGIPSMAPVSEPFGTQVKTLNVDQARQKPVEVRALQDRTFGNIITNVLLPKELLTQLRNSAADTTLFEVKITNPETHKCVIAPLKQFFSQVPLGKPLVYPGSSQTALGGLLEIAVNEGDAAKKLGLDLRQSHPLHFEVRPVQERQQ